MKNKLNICLDTLVFGLQKRGGVSVYWLEFIARMLSDESVNLSLLEINQPYVNDLYTNLDRANANILHEHGSNLQMLRNVSPFLPETKERTVFQSTYLRTTRKGDYVNVVTIHDFTHQIYFSGVKKWLNGIQKQRALKNADGIICISESTKRDLLKRYPETPQDRIKIIYNGASNDYRPLDQYIIPERYKDVVGEKYIIYVGDRFSYKNTGFLFKILKAQRELCLVLVGGNDYTEKELSEMSDIKDRVFRYTKVPNEELNILYNAAFACVFPSLYEGFGIPVLEAMKAACPVIAFNNSSIPEVMNGSGILLENNDLEGCLKALKRLKDDDFRRELTEKELQASKKFSWDKAYEELIAFYRYLLTDRVGGGNTQ